MVLIPAASVLSNKTYRVKTTDHCAGLLLWQMSYITRSVISVTDRLSYLAKFGHANNRPTASSYLVRFVVTAIWVNRSYRLYTKLC